MSKGGKSSTSTSSSTATAPDYLQSGLTDSTQDATNLYAGGAPQYYPGESVAPLNTIQTQALNNTVALANAGSPLVNSAQTSAQNILDTPSGAGNPVLQQLINTVGGQAVSAVNGSFNQGNRMGSGSNASTAATAFGNAALPLLFQQYNNDQQNKIATAAQAPGLANEDFTEQGYAGAAGDVFQQNQQAQDTGAQTAYNYNASAPENFLNNYLQQLYSNPQNNTVQNGTNTTTQKSSGGVLSGLLTAASLLAAPMTGGLSLGGTIGSGIGSLFSGLTAAQGIGSLAGSVAGGGYNGTLSGFGITA